MSPVQVGLQASMCAETRISIRKHTAPSGKPSYLPEGSKVVREKEYRASSPKSEPSQRLKWLRMRATGKRRRRKWRRFLVRMRWNAILEFSGRLLDGVPFRSLANIFVVGNDEVGSLNTGNRDVGSDDVNNAVDTREII